MSPGTTAKRLSLLAVLLSLATAAGVASAVASPPPPLSANAVLPNEGILAFKLGVRPPAGERLSRIGTGMYRTVDHGVGLLVWRSGDGVVERIEARRANSLRLAGRPLSAGYPTFKRILTPEGWKLFSCGAGVRGLLLTGRSGSLTFVRWDGSTALASVSLPSQPPVFGVCGDLGRPPSAK